MKIAMTASEAAPYAKSGGLGDVMLGLPNELARIPDNEVCLFLPYYKRVKENPAYETELCTEFRVGLSWREQYAGLHKLKTKGRKKQPTVYFIDNEYYFGRDGLYGYLDDGERYAFFSKAVLDAMAVLQFYPDVIQSNDWQTAMVPVYLNAQYRGVFPYTKTVFTIHNIEYQGWANPDFFDNVLGLPESFRGIMDLTGGVNMMKGAIECADIVSTVSETYAQEIRYPYYAHGLDGILSGYWYKLVGITNGVDVSVFDPSTDKALVQKYSIQDYAAGKAANKAAMQRELGLPERPEVPVLAMITRLAGHKGIDLLCYIARRLLELDVQLVILGTGEQRFENFFRGLAAEYPDKVSAQLRFDLNLANRIYAGADVYLMPSKSEPCGLSQMNAMRYGTVPVVNATGGLKDTVPPVDSSANTGLGYTFQSYNGDDFWGAIDRCLGLYWHDKDGWNDLIRRDMSADFSWKKPAEKYMALFHRLKG